MVRVLAVVNQKGGVGKTTTSVNLAASLAASGQNTLLVDMDPQGSAGSGLGICPAPNEKTIYHALLGLVPVAETIRATEIKNLSLLPANTQLCGAEIELVGTIARETHLKKTLKPLLADYEWIILDCPPSMGLLTINALTAADGLLVPLQCEYYALEGLTHLLKTIELIKGSLNPSLKIEGIIPTMYDTRNRLCKQVLAEAKKHFPEAVYKTIIPRNVRLSEAPSHGQPVMVYDLLSKGSQAYLALAKEMVKRTRPGTVEKKTTKTPSKKKSPSREARAR